MSISTSLSVETRQKFGKGNNRRLRSEKFVPGVFYTAQGENIPVQIPALPLEKAYQQVGTTTVFNLEISDNGSVSTHPVFFWQVQRHPYKKAFTHIDFYGVDLDKQIKVKVPVKFVGVSSGVKLGGRLETYRETLYLKGKPMEIPSEVIIDVSNMGINSSISVADIQLPDNVSAIYDRNFAMVSVTSKEAAAENTEESAS